MEDFPKLAPLPVEPEEDEVADDLKVQKKSSMPVYNILIAV